MTNLCVFYSHSRGTGASLPFSCYQNDVERALAAAATPIFSNSSDTALGTQWADSENFAEACYALQKQAGSLIGTAFTARDMMQITEALNEDGLLRYWGKERACKRYVWRAELC